MPPPLLRTTPSSPAVAATSLEGAVVTATAASPHATASLLRLIPHRFSARSHRHGHRVSSDKSSHHHCHRRFLCTLPPPAVFLLVLISQCVCQPRRCSRKITRGQSDEWMCNVNNNDCRVFRCTAINLIENKSTFLHPSSSDYTTFPGSSSCTVQTVNFFGGLKATFAPQPSIHQSTMPLLLPAVRTVHSSTTMRGTATSRFDLKCACKQIEAKWTESEWYNYYV